MASQTYTVHNAVEGIILKVKEEEEEEKEEKKNKQTLNCRKIFKQ